MEVIKNVNWSSASAQFPKVGEVWLVDISFLAVEVSIQIPWLRDYRILC